MGLSLNNLVKGVTKAIGTANAAKVINSAVNNNSAVKTAVNNVLGTNGTKLKADPQGTIIKDSSGNDVGISYKGTPTWLSSDPKSSRDTREAVLSVTSKANGNNSAAVNNAATSTATNGIKINNSGITENDYINQIADLQKAAKEAEYANAYNKVLAQLDESRAKTNAEYRKQMNSADVANQMNLKNYFENVANRGQTYSGSTSQGELALRIAGMNNQSTLANSRAQALANLDRDEAQAYNDYLTNLATSGATIEAQRFQNLLEQYRLDKKEEKELFERQIATVSQYYQDYTAEIERREATNPDDPLIPYLKIARQKKIDELEEKTRKELEAAQKLEQQEFTNLLKLNDFAGLRALGYDTTNLERDYNLSVANTQSQIAKRYSSGSSSRSSSKSSSSTTKSQYSNVLKGVQSYLTNNGEVYDENIKGANYLVGEVMNGDISVEEMSNIMRQTGMPIAVVARSLKQNYHENDEDIEAFVGNYIGEISEDYMNKIIDYANGRSTGNTTSTPKASIRNATTTSLR